MCMRIVLSSTIVVLVSSVAFAGIGQFQAFSANLNELAILGSGPGVVNWAQPVVVVKNQSAWDVPVAWGTQQQGAVMGQGGTIIGLGAPVAVGQQMAGGVVQGQLIAGGSGPMVEGQSLGVSAGQGIVKGIGFGMASAGQGAVLSGNQAGGNAAGMMGESSTIIAGQSANVAGLAGALVAGSIGVTSTQGQIDF